MIRRPVLSIALLALASLAIYTFAFVLPYNWLDRRSETQLTIYKISGGDPWAGAAYVAAVVALFAAYALAWRIARGVQRPGVWVAVVAGALAFNAAMLWLYPVDSADIFDNIMHARMQVNYAANPFYQAPVEFQSDPFYPYVGWIYYQTAYGPLWESIAAATARIAGDGISANLIAFKFVSIAASALIALLIALTLRREQPKRALAGVVAFAWNPLVIYSAAGNGHNDTVMALFIVLGFFFFARGRFTLAALAQTAAALIKFIPVLIVPIVLVGALKRLPDRRARLRYAIVTLAACAALAAAVYAPYWRGGDILGAQRRSEVLTNTIPAVIESFIDVDWGLKLGARIVSELGLVLMLAWTVRQLRWTWRDGDAIRAGFSVLLFYLLAAAIIFQPWYLVWVVAVAPLVSESFWVIGSVLFSFAAMGKMPVFDFAMGVHPGYLPALEWREWRITLATLGLPWVYFSSRSARALIGRSLFKRSLIKRSLTAQSEVE